MVLICGETVIYMIFVNFQRPHVDFPSKNILEMDENMILALIHTSWDIQKSAYVHEPEVTGQYLSLLLKLHQDHHELSAHQSRAMLSNSVSISTTTREATEASRECSSNPKPLFLSLHSPHVQLHEVFTLCILAFEISGPKFGREKGQDQDRRPVWRHNIRSSCSTPSGITADQ